MGKPNRHSVDNGNVELYPSVYPLGFTSESVPNTNNPPIMSIKDDYLDQLLELFQS